MAKNAKHHALKMLKMSTSSEGKKEVVNACLFVLKALPESPIPLNSTELKKLNGGAGGISCYLGICPFKPDEMGYN